MSDRTDLETLTRACLKLLACWGTCEVLGAVDALRAELDRQREARRP